MFGGAGGRFSTSTCCHGTVGVWETSSVKGSPMHQARIGARF